MNIHRVTPLPKLLKARMEEITKAIRLSVEKGDDPDGMLWECGEPMRPPAGAIGWVTGEDAIAYQIPKERLRPFRAVDRSWVFAVPVCQCCGRPLP